MRVKKVVKIIARNKKSIRSETRRHDFENEFAYIEKWVNGQLVDCFFCEKEYLFLDGSLKKGGRKYFFSPFSDDLVEKDIISINCENFSSFDKLFYVDESGEIIKINGEPLINL